MKDKGPKYQQVADWITQQIDTGEFLPGERILSEMELAEQFSVSRQTVRHAIALLEQQDMLESRRGSGTFVIQPTAVLPQAAQRTVKTIGVISTYLDSYIFPQIIKGIEKVLAKEGYHMQLALTHNQVESETRALESLMEIPLDGLIVEPTKSSLPNPNVEHYQKLKAQGVPVIFFNAVYPMLEFPYVALDDTAVGERATEYLISQGHTRIGGFFLSDDRQGHLRYAGYLKSLQQAQIPLRSSDVFWFTTEGVPYLAEESSRIVELAKRCTAIVCYNDETAFQIFSVLKEHDIRVPEDVSLIGVDNSDLSQWMEVPLTTIEHPSEALGERAAQDVLQLITDPGYSAGKLFAPNLIERTSVKKQR